MLRKTQLFLLSQHTLGQITVPQPSVLHFEQSQLSQSVLIHHGLQMPNQYSGFSEGLLNFAVFLLLGSSALDSALHMSHQHQRVEWPTSTCWQSSFQCRGGCPCPWLMLEQNAGICWSVWPAGCSLQVHPMLLQTYSSLIVRHGFYPCWISWNSYDLTSSEDSAGMGCWNSLSHSHLKVSTHCEEKMQQEITQKSRQMSWLNQVKTSKQ